MDFMNLNQSAHGDREFGYVLTRLRIPRTTIVGHWQDPFVTERLGRLGTRGGRRRRGAPAPGLPVRRQHAPGRA